MARTKVVLSAWLFVVFWVSMDVSCLFLPLHDSYTPYAAHSQITAARRNSSFQSNGICQKGLQNQWRTKQVRRARADCRSIVTGGVFCRNPAGFEPPEDPSNLNHAVTYAGGSTLFWRPNGEHDDGLGGQGSLLQAPAPRPLLSGLTVGTKRNEMPPSIKTSSQKWSVATLEVTRHVWHGACASAHG